MTGDIRWRQRFSNYCRALLQLQKFLVKHKLEGLNEFEQQGLIQAFEYTFELAWNVMRDFFKQKGNENIYGSRDAIMEAFRAGLIFDGETWMQMIKDRNQTSHTYNEDTSEEISTHIINSYEKLFQEFQEKMEKMA